MPTSARPSNLFLKSLFILNLFAASIVLEAGYASPARYPGEPVPAAVELVVSTPSPFSLIDDLPQTLCADFTARSPAPAALTSAFRYALRSFECHVRVVLQSRTVFFNPVVYLLRNKSLPRSSLDEAGA